MASDRSNRPPRALILGDSLGAPRPHRGQKLEITWPVLLKQRFPDVDIWQRCRPGSMSDAVRKEYNLFSDSLDGFDLLTIQVGIGDCCPRPYPYWFEQLIQTYAWKNLHQRLNSLYPLLLRFRARQWIDRAEFVNNIRFMIDTTLARRPTMAIRVVVIGTPCHDFVRKARHVASCAADYNAALATLCRSYACEANVALIDPYSEFVPEDLFIADGHHLTELGHRAVADALAPSFGSIAKHDEFTAASWPLPASAVS